MSGVVLEWARTYDRRWWRADVLAGVTAGAVVIPQAMGYATVAGLPIEVGLYTCIVPVVVYALLGGARRLSMTTTSTIAALTALALAAAGAGAPDQAMESVTTLTLLVGLALLLFRLLRLAWVVDTISDTVVIGLRVGVGLTIIVDQLPDLLGIDATVDGFFRGIGSAWSHLAEANAATVIVAATTTAGLVATRRWLPAVPGPLLALAAGIGATALLDLGGRGVELIPPVPSGLPIPALPATGDVATLVPYALAIALMAYMETIAVGRSTREPRDPPISDNRELVANGAAAVAGAFFATAPPAGGFSQTMVNAGAGARTQLSELVTAALAVAAAVFLAPLFADLPQATLAAIVVIAVAGLVSLDEFRRLARIDRVELAVAVVTGVIALVTNLLVGVVAGALLTFYLVLRRLNHPTLVELRRPPGGIDLEPARPGDQPVPGLLAIRVEGGLYTMNVRAVQAEVLRRVAAAETPPRVLLVDARGTVDTSITVMDVFAETDQLLAQRGVTLWVAALPTAALLKVRRTTAWAAWRDSGRVYRTVRAALEAHDRSAGQDGGRH